MYFLSSKNFPSYFPFMFQEYFCFRDYSFVADNSYDISNSINNFSIKFLLQYKHLKCNIFNIYFCWLSQNGVFDVKSNEISFLKIITCICFSFFLVSLKTFLKNSLSCFFPFSPPVLINILKTFLIKLKSRKLGFIEI